MVVANADRARGTAWRQACPKSRRKWRRRRAAARIEKITGGEVRT